MSEETEIRAALALNAAFYRALGEGDVAAMDSLWATAGPVICGHPGAPPLHGRDAVMGSWRQMLRSPPPHLGDGSAGRDGARTGLHHLHGSHRRDPARGYEHIDLGGWGLADGLPPGGPTGRGRPGGIGRRRRPALRTGALH